MYWWYVAWVDCRVGGLCVGGFFMFHRLRCNIGITEGVWCRLSRGRDDIIGVR